MLWRMHGWRGSQYVAFEGFCFQDLAAGTVMEAAAGVMRLEESLAAGAVVIYMNLVVLGVFLLVSSLLVLVQSLEVSFMAAQCPLTF